MKKVKVVLADDEEIFNANRTQFLSKIDYVEILGVAKDGLEEYQMIKKFNPDIVITDNQMPKMTGIEVIKRTRMDDSISKKPKFIIISYDSLKEYKNGMEKFNIIDIIQKKIGFHEVNEFIKEDIEVYKDFC